VPIGDLNRNVGLESLDDSTDSTDESEQIQIPRFNPRVVQHIVEPEPIDNEDYFSSDGEEDIEDFELAAFPGETELLTKLKRLAITPKIPGNDFVDVDGPGFVYIFTDRSNERLIQDPNSARWKVGSSKHPKRRFQQLKTGNIDLRMVSFFHVRKRLTAERAAHNILRLKGLHILLEWFRGPMDEVIEAVFEAICPFE